MIRKIIHIDEETCSGCGLCVDACHEGAISLIGGKARLMRDAYCDGLGDCLPACPMGSITFEEREAEPYDEAAVQERMANRVARSVDPAGKLPCGCPGTHARTLHPTPPTTTSTSPSQLAQWPVQLKLVPVSAPYFANADLLIAADCSAYACGSFHNDFMQHRVTLIGCPKLDEGDYTEKLTAILTQNTIQSVTLTRMEVPCCGGLERAVKSALERCGKNIPVQIVTLSTHGTVLDM